MQSSTVTRAMASPLLLREKLTGIRPLGIAIQARAQGPKGAQVAVTINLARPLSSVTQRAGNGAAGQIGLRAGRGGVPQRYFAVRSPGSRPGGNAVHFCHRDTGFAGYLRLARLQSLSELKCPTKAHQRN